MKLFKAKITVWLPQEVEIPVAAESAEKAMDYLQANSDWHKDSMVTSFAEDGSRITPSGVVEVTRPADCEWDEETQCWNEWDVELSAKQIIHKTMQEAEFYWLAETAKKRRAEKP